MDLEKIVRPTIMGLAVSGCVYLGFGAQAITQASYNHLASFQDSFLAFQNQLAEGDPIMIGVSLLYGAMAFSFNYKSTLQPE